MAVSMMPNQIRNELEKLADQQAVFGDGSFVIPGLAVPQMVVGDANRNMETDYAAGLNTSNTLALVYIRRAATAERFAMALESELEALRNKTKGN